MGDSPLIYCLLHFQMNYQWRSVIGKGSLVYIINNMLMDLSFILDLQRLQLKIQTVRFDNRKA
jgi:hypothetical protein